MRQREKTNRPASWRYISFYHAADVQDLRTFAGKFSQFTGWGLGGFEVLTHLSNNIWSSISSKLRSLYSILDLLYFMLPYTMRHLTVSISWLNFVIVHDTFCFSYSISRIWDVNLTIFCCFDKEVNYVSFDFRSCVFNIQVRVFGFVRHPSAIHWERTSRAQVISTAIPAIAVAVNPPVEWSRGRMILPHHDRMF